MIIIEITLTVDDNGNLILPQTLLADMGIKVGEQVSIAYISTDKNSPLNTYKEFLITPAGMSAVNNSIDTGTIYLPDELLDAADISQNSDVIIECEYGMIKISTADSIPTLNNPAEEMRQIAGALKSINSALEQSHA